MPWKTLCCAVATAAAGMATSAFGGDFTYLHDDGRSNGATGPNFGDGYIALNAFTVSGGFDTITSIDVSWFGPDGDETVAAAMWSDPNQDGDPSDGVLLGTSAAVFASAGNGGFQNLALTSPIDVGSAGDWFFAGVYFETDPEMLSVGTDTDYAGPTVSWGFAYPGGAPDPNDLMNPRSFDSIAFMIRANAVPAPGALALLALGGLGAFRRRG